MIVWASPRHDPRPRGSRRPRDTDPLRYEREIKQARSLLFVAATRARDSLVICWHGAPSPLLPAGGSRRADAR